MSISLSALAKISALLLAVIITMYISQLQYSNEHILQFEEWKTKYNKNYKDGQHIFRYAIYMQNKMEIAEHNKRANANLQSWYMGINKFADITQQQFISLYLNSDQVSKSGNKMYEAAYNCSSYQPVQRTIPDAFDWGAKSALTAVKDHGTCMAGYAFAAVQSIEASRYITSGKLVQLSPQQLIDCTADYGNKGCISGNITGSFAYLHKAGVASEKKYPYKGFAYNCAYNTTQKQAEILGCVRLASNKQAVIKNAVFSQPFAAAINAAKIKNYEKGVFQTTFPLINPCKNQPNHWMLLVGYGRDDQKKKNYWKLKNSWGSHWGEQGYLYIIRNGDGEGECGVQAELYAPIG